MQSIASRCAPFSQAVPAPSKSRGPVRWCSVSGRKWARSVVSASLNDPSVPPVTADPYIISSTGSSMGASRRQSLAAVAAAAATVVWPVSGAHAAGVPSGSDPDLTVTDKIYLDIAVADTAFKAAGERTLGDRTIVPEPKTPLGRIEIGLYGNVAPATVHNLLAAVRSGGLDGTVFSRISPGEYIQAGRQGSKRLGEVEGVPGLQPNNDLYSPAGFKLTHSRPGTVSLSISADNDEDPATRERANYRPLEFLITTGPGPVPRLDGLNLVFGRVTSGLTTVAAVAAVPSFQPDARSQQLNAFAKWIGDDRADKVRRRYGRPLKAIVITSAGVVGEEPGAATGTQRPPAEAVAAL